MEKRTKTYFSKDKGVAGLTILLSVVAMLFIIGFLIMIFVVMGAKLQEAQYEPTTTTLTNKVTATTVNSSSTTAITTLNSSLRDCVLTVSAVTNKTDGVAIASGNYTTVGCLITATATVTPTFNNTLWNVTGSYSYSAVTTTTGIIGDTTSSLADVPTWFPIIITIAVMVSLILLTVIIIVAIRSSGLLMGGN